MKKAYTISKVVTVIFIVITVLSALAAVCGITIIGFLMEGFDWVGDVINNASSHDLTGGYEVLGSLGIGLMDGLLILAVGIPTFGGIIFFMTGIVPSIVGVIQWRRYSRDMDVRHLTTDAIVKAADVILLMTAEATLSVSMGYASSIGGTILANLPFLLLAALSVIQYVIVKDGQNEL